MRSWKKIAIASAALLFPAQLTLQAQEDFLTRFEGEWKGSGTVQPSFDESTHNVNCSMSGTESGQSVSVDGNCRAYLIFSRDISVDVQAGPDGTYSGTYVGSPVGPANLSGTRQGDSLDLSIRWPKEVNGDLEAQMRVTAAEGGTLRIEVFDQVGGEGSNTKMTDISLSKA